MTYVTRGFKREESPNEELTEGTASHTQVKEEEGKGRAVCSVCKEGQRKKESASGLTDYTDIL